MDLSHSVSHSKWGEAMYNAKVYSQLHIMLILFVLLLSLSGCQSSGTSPDTGLPDYENAIQENEAVDPEDEEVPEEAENGVQTDDQETSPQVLLTFSFPAGDFILSPDGKLLYFTMPSAPGTLFHVIDLSAVEIGSEPAAEIEFEAAEPLQTTSVMGETYHLQIAGDGSSLLYATSEIQWDETEYGEKTIIYFSRPDFPPDVDHQLELVGDEVPYSFGGAGIKPVWEAGTDNIYFLTLYGVYRYSTEERKKTLIYPSADLPGVIRDGQLAPHAFYLDGEHKELAYYNDGVIYIVSLTNKVGNPETIIVDPGDDYIAGLEYLFNGSYLVLEDGPTSSGYGLDNLSLTFVERQSGAVLLESNDYLPAGYILDDQGLMLFKGRGIDNRGYFALLDSNLNETSRISATGIMPPEEFFYSTNAIRPDGRWALPLYVGMDLHFIEISFD